VGAAALVFLIGGGLLLAFEDQIISSESAKKPPTPTSESTEKGATSQTPPPSTTNQSNVVEGKKESAALASLRGKVIGIDPAHNGQNSVRVNRISRLVPAGSTKAPCDELGVEFPLNNGASQVSESALAMSVAQIVRTQLENAGAQVRLTRRNDESWGPCVDKRAAVVSGTDAAISLHTHVATKSVRGFAVRIADPDSGNRGSERADADRKLALSMAQSWRDTTGLQPSRAAGADGVVEDARVVLLNITESPIVQLEMGNLTNTSDRSILTDPADADRLASAIVSGLALYMTPPNQGNS
jgi:N-acetylmuramoyl-L-alanine amidase